MALFRLDKRIASVAQPYKKRAHTSSANSDHALARYLLFGNRRVSRAQRMPNASTKRKSSEKGIFRISLSLTNQNKSIGNRENLRRVTFMQESRHFRWSDASTAWTEWRCTPLIWKSVFSKPKQKYLCDAIRFGSQCDNTKVHLIQESKGRCNSSPSRKRKQAGAKPKRDRSFHKRLFAKMQFPECQVLAVEVQRHRIETCYDTEEENWQEQANIPYDWIRIIVQIT